MQEKYRNEMVARYGPDQDNHPSFDGAAWCEASGGVSKGRVYGAPRMPKSKVDVSSSSHTYSVNSSYPSTTTNRRYQEQLDKMETKISSIEDCLKLLVGHMGLTMPTPGAPSLPSPMAPSMPSPTMAPVYRPRPRPQPQPQIPYNGPSSSHPQHRRSFPP